MNVYHRTDEAEEILENGFQDGTGYYMTGGAFSGVFVSDRPLDPNEGAIGHEVIEIGIPSSLFTDYEWEEVGKPYREALIPAAELNAYMFVFGEARITA
jgi:hypothetical protein